MADLSDPRIQEGELSIRRLVGSADRDRLAYQDVRSDKSDTNWVLLDYEVRFMA
jgi:hypothetical protein